MKRIFTGALFFMLTCPLAYADRHVQGSITVCYTNKNLSKDMIYSSYKQLIEIDNILMKMQDDAVKSANASNSTNERYEFDVNYQSKLEALKQLIKADQHLYLTPSPDNNIEITTKTATGEWVFTSLKHLDMDSLGLKGINLKTTANAEKALQDIERAVTLVKQQLPDAQDTSNWLVKPSVNQNADENDITDCLYLNNESEKQKILSSIAELRFFIIERLMRLVELTDEAMMEGADQLRVDSEFQQALNYLFTDVTHFNILKKNSVLTNSEISNHNNDKTYKFPKLRIKQFKLERSHIYDIKEAHVVLTNIHKMSDYIRDIILQ
ncbi:hypothetical protein ELY21_13810 [Legionella sp. km535]|uniref:hypothetical protein n=1 Tax=Legionella sp. km535 TaxID=2498107 RepID=UPI000F8DFFFD|nr:hypothetical protein [Legionella sp. km535]RUR15870.1 hypothetical protein ELY21_13810 [Legionella sp. km535]